MVWMVNTKRRKYLNCLEHIDCWLTQVTFLSFFSGKTLQNIDSYVIIWEINLRLT